MNRKEAYNFGLELIYPERATNWAICVNNRYDDLYGGSDLVNAVRAMKVLDEGKSLEEAEKVVDKANHSGASYGMVIKILANFSKRGTNYVRKFEPESAKRNFEWLESVDKENFSYEPEATRDEYKESFLKEKDEILKQQKIEAAKSF